VGSILDPCWKRNYSAKKEDVLFWWGFSLYAFVISSINVGMHMKYRYTNSLWALLIASMVGMHVAAQSQVPLTLSEQVAQARIARDAAYRVAPLKDKIAAYFASKAKKKHRSGMKERVRTLVELTDAEWQLREKLLQQQKKNRLQLFLNKHEQELRMALIALGFTTAAGYTGKKIYEKTAKNQAARDAVKTARDAVKKEKRARKASANTGSGPAAHSTHSSSGASAGFVDPSAGGNDGPRANPLFLQDEPSSN
jgi:hypothetical protein